jgi:hypothetical protein
MDARMKVRNNGRAVIIAASLATALIGARTDAQSIQISGASCTSPPPLHCPDANCPNELAAHHGTTRLPKSNRAFFLDYPCDLKPGEAVTFVLSLHGAGIAGNWHRHYFPLVDLTGKYRLVVATPSAVNSMWNPDNDEAHLRNIVDFIYAQVGAKNIKAFWLAGHSDGGLMARRLLMMPFYRDRLTGWVSLSGGRLGSKRAHTIVPGGPGPSTRRVTLADASLPDYGFSHIYTSGEHELAPAGLPDHSLWAQKLECKAQTRRPDIVDTKAGYVWDSRLPLTRGPRAGRKPRPGRAQVFVYPECGNGHVVADVIRLDKGHTEGLEPNVTEEIVKLMLSAR